MGRVGFGGGGGGEKKRRVSDREEETSIKKLERAGRPAGRPVRMNIIKLLNKIIHPTFSYKTLFLKQ